MGATAARLARFYAGTSMWEWLAVIPLAVVWAAIEMLPRLQAEESHLAVVRVGIGSGAVPVEEQKRIRHIWDRVIAGLPPVEPRTPRTADDIRKLGFKVFGGKAQA